MKILFVCTGNICRSPTAEAVLRHYAEKEARGLNLIVDSAGTHSYHVGEPPDRRAVQAAQNRGILMRGMKARKVILQDFDEFDYIFAMDREHYSFLEEMMPLKSRAQLSLFMDLCSSSKNKDVLDPYYGDPSLFETVLNIVEEGTQNFLKKL